MKYLLIFCLTFILEIFFPWYMISVIPFLVCCILPGKPARDFFFSALTIFCLWGMVSVLRDIPNHGILSGRIAALFHLSSGILVMVAGALLGGLMAGLSALTGNYCRDLIRVKQ